MTEVKRWGSVLCMHVWTSPIIDDLVLDLLENTLQNCVQPRLEALAAFLVS